MQVKNTGPAVRELAWPQGCLTACGLLPKMTPTSAPLLVATTLLLVATIPQLEATTPLLEATVRRWRVTWLPAAVFLLGVEQ